MARVLADNQRVSRFFVWLVLAAALHGLTPTASFAEVLPELEEEPMPETLPDDQPAPPAADPPPLRFEATAFAALGVQFGSEHAPVEFGFGLTYGVAWAAFPVSIGLDFLSLSSDYERSRSVLLSDGTRDSALQTARNKTMYFDAWLRVQPANWPVRPYAEAFLGTKLAQTRYVLTWPASRAAGGGGEHSDPVEADDWAHSWGWGLGVDTWGLFKFLGSVSFSLGVRQLYGQKASYDRPVRIAGELVDVRYTQRTTITLFMLGVVARFDLGQDPDPYAPR